MADRVKPDEKNLNTSNVINKHLVAGMKPHIDAYLNTSNVINKRNATDKVFVNHLNLNTSNVINKLKSLAEGYSGGA